MNFENRFGLYTRSHLISNPYLINEEDHRLQHLEESEDILTDLLHLWDVFVEDWHLQTNIIKNMHLLGRSSLVSQTSYNCFG